MLADIPQTWDEIWELGPGVYSWVQSIPLEWQPEDTPSGALRVELSVHNATSSASGGSKTATLAYIDGAAIRTRYVGERSSGGDHWAKLATATPPQEFDLPLAEGLEPIEPCRYSKDQFGRVLVNIDCNPTTGSVSIGENQSLSIGTLPEGFRPAHYTSNACEVIVGQSRYIGTFDINEYGAITLWTAAPSASIIIGSVLFDTA